MSKTVSDWIQDLNSELESERAEAVRALGYFGREAVPGIIEALRAGSVEFDFAAEALSQIGEDAVELLTDVLSDNSSMEMQRMAAHALGRIASQRAVIPLVVALEDDDVEVRAEVAHSLGVFSDARAVAPLIAALQDESALVRASAAAALGNYDRRGVLEALLKAAQDPDSQVRQAALASLARLDDARVQPALQAALADADEDVRHVAAAAMRFREGDLKALDRLVVDESVTHQIKVALEQLMGAVEQTEDEDAADALQHSNPRVRGRLLSQLGEKGGVYAVKLLLPGLSDINPAVRATAVESLKKIGASAMPTLLEALAGHASRYVRAGVAEVLAASGDPQAAEALAQAARSDAEAQVRLSAVRALHGIQGEQVEKALYAALKDSDADVRKAAEEALLARGLDPRKQEGLLAGLRRLLGGKGG